MCFTNKTCCCGDSPNRFGDWYFPDKARVGVDGANGNFYRDRGPSVVRLNRRNDATMPTGVFRCEIPDASGNNQTVYVGVYSVTEGS